MKSNSSTSGKTKKPGEEPGAPPREVEVGTLVPQPHGGALRHGSKPGTNKGGPGRPRNEFKARMKVLLDTQRKTKNGRSRMKADTAIENFLRECLDGDHGPVAFFQAYDRVVDRVEGKVPNASEVRGSDEPLIIRVVTGP